MGREENDQGHQSYGDRRLYSGRAFIAYVIHSSFLGNSGASQGVAGDIVGHDSEAMTGHYTKFDLETRHAAIAKLPRYEGGRDKPNLLDHLKERETSVMHEKA